MKTLFSICLLSVMSAAQAPVATKVNTGVITFTNSGTKPVMTMVVELHTGTGRGIYNQDHYFQSQALQPGDYQEFDAVNPDDRIAKHIPLVTATVLFVQFSDGSTWGDSAQTDVAAALAARKDVKAVLLTLQQAANQSKQAFQDALEQKPDNRVQRVILLGIQSSVQNYGIAKAIEEVNMRVATAQAREMSGKF